MSIFSKLKSFALSAGLALGALGLTAPDAAQALTADANFSMDGLFVYDAELPSLTLTGEGSTAAYVSPSEFSVQKNYNLIFGLTLTPFGSGPTMAMNSTINIGQTSITEVMSFLSMIEAGEVYGSLEDGLLFSRSGFIPSQVTEDIVIGFGAALTEFLMTEMTGGLPQTSGFGTFDLTVDMSAVPLPATLPLLLVGFGGFAALRRRKS